MAAGLAGTTSGEAAVAGPPVPVALRRCAGYDPAGVAAAVGAVLDAALRGAFPVPGMRVLVKPNLLQPRLLACTHPQVVAAACAWLLDHGCRVTVADSPGFGRATAVARAIGLDDALRPLGLAVRGLGHGPGVAVRLDLPPASLAQCGGTPPLFTVAAEALECDALLSIPRIKAHSQMLLSLAVKNCFGCVPGLRKAVVHARQGRDPDCFADCLAALWAALPPVFALADGIEAMHVTGPGRGHPFALGLVAASPSAPALDRVVRELLGAPETPLERALARRAGAGSARARPAVVFPLERPEACRARGFRVPAELAHTSFRPGRLLKSLCRRLWAAARG